jgi:membrane-associated phospholipid phosphatase
VGSRWLSALLAAGACAVGLFWTWLLAFETDLGVRADERIYVAVALRRTPRAAELASHTARLGDPSVYLLLVACVLAIPLLRHRWVLAASGAVLLAGANLTTQVLQELTYGDRHVLLVPGAYWPSGHTTAMVSLVLALVLGVPRSARFPAALVAIVAAIAMGWAVIVLSSHLPSDVVGAAFVCGIWAALVLAALLWREDRFRAASGGRSGAGSA